MRKRISRLLAKCKAVPFSEPIKGGHFFDLKTQSFKLPGGDVITREFVEKRPAAVVVPITTKKKVVCVIQPVSLSKEGSLIEIPAGYAEKGEKSVDTAIRELVEETGYCPKKIKYLGMHYQDPGSIKAPVYVFVALGCERKLEQKLDRDEYIIPIEISRREIKRLMKHGDIKDANTFIAITKAWFERYI